MSHVTRHTSHITRHTSHVTLQSYTPGETGEDSEKMAGGKVRYVPMILALRPEGGSLVILIPS
jgi:hypothetical protein